MTAAISASDLALFQSCRGPMIGLGYRMLGSRADAEDVVQDVFLRWQSVDRAAIATPAAWLMTACANRCIDVIRSAARARTEYVGPWLPEPLPAAAVEEPEGLSETLETAFLTLLQRATPRERAAFLLHEVFDLPHEEVAAALGLTSAASRKLVSRARAALSGDHRRIEVPPDRQRRLLDSFEAALRTDDMAAFAGCLAEDVRLTADSGGKVPSVGELFGAGAALEFLGRARQWWPHYQWTRVALASGVGVLLSDGDAPAALVWFGSRDGRRVSDIFVMRNPDKLALFRSLVGPAQGGG